MRYFIGDSKTKEIAQSSLKELKDYFADKEWIGFDTETSGLDPHSNKILTYQLGDEDNQFVVEQKHTPIIKIKHLLETKSLIMHNAKFDLQFLYNHRIVPNKLWDTFLGEAVLNKGRPFVTKNLKDVTIRYCGIGLDKSIRGLVNVEGMTKRTIVYAADDVKYLLDIKGKQMSKLEELELSKSMELENEFVKALAYTEYCGIYLNKEKWNQKISEDDSNYNRAKDALDNWVIENEMDDYIDNQLDLFREGQKCAINWNSPKQVIPLFKDLGIDTEVEDKNTGKSKNSIDESIITSQQGISDIIPLYLEYKGLKKLTSTYGKNFLKQIHPETGRIHTSFSQIMVTGRLSSGRKDENKVNLQNIPADHRTRSCFTAEEGNVLVTADYSQQEQIVLANWAKDPKILEFYQGESGDMHSFIASKLFSDLEKVPLDKIKEEYKDKRTKAKAAGFAINYGGNGSTIARNLGIPDKQGDELYKGYFKAFPDVHKYFEKVAKKALYNGYIQFNNITKSKSFIPNFKEFKLLQTKVKGQLFWNLYNREKEKHSDLFYEKLKPTVRKYFIMQENIKRKAYNYPIQGSGAEILKIACIYLFKELKRKNLLFKVLFSNIIHDEILLESPKEIATYISDTVKECAERAGDIFCRIVKLKANPVVSSIWEH